MRRGVCWEFMESNGGRCTYKHGVRGVAAGLDFGDFEGTLLVMSVVQTLIRMFAKNLQSGYVCSCRGA